MKNYHPYLSPPPSQMSDGLIKTYFSPEWIYRYVMIGCFVGLLYLNSHYIPREEYFRDQIQIKASLDVLKDKMDEFKLSIKMLEKNTEELTDHEHRLRILEHVAAPMLK